MNGVQGLLAQVGCVMAQRRERIQTVLQRQEMTRLFLDQYALFYPLRLHLFHRHEQPVLHASAQHTLVNTLVDRGWIRAAGPQQWVLHRLSPEEQLYLQGGWLEELLFLAHKAAGCDEVYLNAQLNWQVDGIDGTNEVDVLARRGSLLSFTSCKCVRPVAGRTHEQVRGFLLEAAYWNTHFAGGLGRAVLAVTADLFDEVQTQHHRYPMLHARATVIDVDLLGLEDLSWTRLVAALDTHWDVDDG
jgi:hypothetical protein